MALEEFGNRGVLFWGECIGHEFLFGSTGFGSIDGQLRSLDEWSQ